MLNRHLEDEEFYSGESDSEILRETFFLYGSLFVVVWLIFCFVRRRYKAYNVRSWLFKWKCDLASQEHGLFGWALALYRVSDGGILEQCGMDALSLLRVLSFGFKLSMMGVFTSIFLLPIYKTAPSGEDTEYITDVAAELTIANVPSGDNRLIAAVVAAYLVFGYTMVLLKRDFEWFTANRLKFLSRDLPRNYSIYVSGIPPQYRSRAALFRYFGRIFSEQKVLETQVALNIPRLERKVATREAVVAKLEHCMALEEQTRVTPRHRTVPSPVGETVNSIAAYQEKLEELNTEIRNEIERLEERNDETPERHADGRQGSASSFHSCEEVMKEEPVATDERAISISPSNGAENDANGQPVDDLDAGDTRAAPPHEADEENDHVEQTKESSHSNHLVSKAAAFIGMGSEEGLPLDAAFVTFTSLTSTNAALQLIYNVTPFQMDVREAPNHMCILWQHVGLMHEAVQFGILVAFALSATLCLFWTVPVTAIISLTEVENLQKRWPALEDYMEHARWLEPLLNQLSPLLLSLLNSSLPIIMKIIANLEGHIGEADLEASLFAKLSAFHIVQTFFVANISSSVMGALNTFFDNTSDIVTFLATTLPLQSTLYIQLVLIATVIGLGLELLRVTPLFQSGLRGVLGPNLTEEEKNTTWHGLRPLSDPRDFFHARALANAILFLMVAYVYTIIAPICCYVLAFCFLVQGAGYRHQLIYVYPPKPDSGGRLWMKFVNITLPCVLVAQITLMGYFLLKSSIAFYLMIPLVVVQVLFHVYIWQRHFRVAFRLPTEDSLRLDEEKNVVDFSFLEGKYRQPALRTKEILPECVLINAEVEAVLDGSTALSSKAKCDEEVAVPAETTATEVSTR